MITHHPSAELLLDYASGALFEAQALAVATHTAMCSLCRAEVERLESLGGAMLGALCEAENDNDALLSATLSRLDEAVAENRAGAASIDETTRQTVPSPLWPYMDGGIERLKWRRLARGLHEAVLPAPGAQASLLRIGSGVAVPDHTHHGSEMTVVFAGGFSDSLGHYIRGDFALADASHDHRPIADSGEDCLCLAVTEGPARLTGRFARALNPIFDLVRKFG